MEGDVALLIKAVLDYEYLTEEDIKRILQAVQDDDVSDSDDDFLEPKKGNKWVSRLKRGVKGLGIGFSLATLAALLADAMSSEISHALV